ncbi:tetratricopeptide repeat protein [Polluticoccus soli]|uniref:tetratricopeptide repeat-containing hybrid sensor histidine kinase/response regulator n=1 Tax=Polluticoccus soli TaxID=3034150 RepID=UPI0023E2CC11|nr:tetratricopeptide repeat protein [Flavipsychrobacter sp. JY13-12]
MDTPRYKELQEIYDSLHNERARIDTLIEMAMEVRNFDVDKAAVIADEVIARSEKSGYRLAKGRGLNLKGWCFWQQGEYDDGIAILEEALKVAREINHKPLEARILNNFGYIYRDQGELAEALNYFEKALAINENLGDEVAQSVNLASIAYINYDLNDYENALEFALKCLPIFEKANDVHRLNSLYNILGNIYFKQEQYDEALRYFEGNLDHSEPDTAMHITSISGVGKVYYKMNNFAEASRYLYNALEQSQELGNVEVQIICHYYIGRMMMEENNYRQALQSLDSAFELADEYQRKHDVMSVHEGLSILYDKMGDIPKAFHHLKAYEELKEEIFKQTTFNKLRNLQTRQQIELAQKEKEVAERTANLKQQFMANMSHEIRTPMNAIVGMTRLLLSREPRDEQKKYLNAIRQSADNLLVIINDILDLSKIEAGKIVIEQTDFALREIAQSMRDMLLLKAEEKNVDFRLQIDPVIPNRIVGDPTRVNQVLINLAGNAIKFTEKGYVEVSAKLQKPENGKIWIQFDVTDTGIGIAPDYVDKIFESFTQAGTDVARKFGGTGLGLTISRQLVELMQGTISVKSKLGEGTTFTVIIPFEESSIQSVAASADIVDDDTMQRLNKVKLLLVEDNEFNRMVAEDTLKEILPGITIDIAVNGQEAVDRVQQEQYDMLLMDIQMPVMDGLTATHIIRKKLQAPTRNVKIIAMTANVLQEDVKQYFDAGMDAYVSKPFQTDELLLKMATVLENRLPRPQVDLEKKPIASPQMPPLPNKVTDMQFLKQFTGGKVDKMNKYIGMFLENGPRLLTNVEQSLDKKDYPSLKIAAHSLKPQLSYMGVKEDVSHIFLIEQTAGESAHYERLPELVTNLKRICEKAFEELRSPDITNS